jgi:hypothetical protein
VWWRRRACQRHSVLNGHAPPLVSAQVSCTVTFEPETEGPQLRAALDVFQYQLKGVSFLPRQPSGAYAQMPYEAITAEQFKTMVRAAVPLCSGVIDGRCGGGGGGGGNRSNWVPLPLPLWVCRRADIGVVTTRCRCVCAQSASLKPLDFRQLHGADVSLPDKYCDAAGVCAVR